MNELCEAYVAADKAWRAELERQYGPDRKALNYDRAIGEPGSPLREAWEKREVARQAFEVLINGFVMTCES